MSFRQAEPGVARLLQALKNCRLGAAAQVVSIDGGRNNRAFRVDLTQGPLFAKVYHRDTCDSWDRLGAETSFLRWAQTVAPGYTPRLIAVDQESGVAFHEWLGETRFSADAVDAAAVARAIEFIGILQCHRSTAHQIAAASEAYFDLPEHVAGVDRRLRALSLTEDEEVRELVVRDVYPMWERVRARLERESSDVVGPLPYELRCVSPSDFGFHNAMQDAGKCRFVDFEYAGWDDPAKLVADFFAQPSHPVSRKYRERFAGEIVTALGGGASLRRRIDAYDGLFRMKWCAIVLNIFLPAGRMRRESSLGVDGASALEANQKDLARSLVESLVEEF